MAALENLMPGLPRLSCKHQGPKIPAMKLWRKSIICLLLLTVPLSLWAAVATPKDCSLDQPAEQTRIDDMAAHAHHGMSPASSEMDDHDNSKSIPADPNAPCSCCNACLAACLASGISVLNLQLQAVDSPAASNYFSKTLASPFLPGPSYPSLYRPPISRI